MSQSLFPRIAVGAVLSLQSLTIAAAPFSDWSARSAAMGGVGVAVAGLFTPLTNPAHLALVDVRRDIFMDLPVAARADSTASQLKDPLAEFQAAAADFSATPTPVNQTRVATTRTRLAGQRDEARRFAAGVMGLPQLPVSLGAYVLGNYLETREAQVGGNLDLSDPANPKFDASVALRAVSTIESGAVLARVLRSTSGGSNRLAVGISPKLVLARTYYYEHDAATIDLDSAAKLHRDDAYFNLDAGLVKEFGFVWKAGLAIRNVVPRNLAFDDPQASRIHLGPQARAGIAYRAPRVIYAADLDLTANGAVGFEPRTRILAAGTEYILRDYLRLRGGAFVNLLDGRAGLSGGFGLDVAALDLDLALFGDTDRTVGGFVRLGLKL